MTIDLDELERMHREGLRYPEGVEYDVARTEAFDALPELLRLARRARRHYECLVGEYERLRAQLAEREAELAALRSSERERLIRDACGAWDGGSPIADPMNSLTRFERARRAKEKP